jgi:hypothetical protein
MAKGSSNLQSSDTVRVWIFPSVFPKGYICVCKLKYPRYSTVISTWSHLKNIFNAQECMAFFQRNLAGITPWGASPRIDLYSFIDSTLDNSQIAVPDRTNPIYADMMP